MTMVALFDLDETLVKGDTSDAWSHFAVDNHLFPGDAYLDAGKLLHQSYLNGDLDIFRYMAHSLRPIKGRSVEEVAPYIERFVNDVVKPKVYPQAWELLQSHRDQGHHLVLISASSAHIVCPIGEMLGVDVSLGCEPEIIDNRYSGIMTGIPSFQVGKVTRFEAWVKEQAFNVEKTWFYSDSQNDLPLLEYADNPVAVNPVASLENIAKTRHWPVIHWSFESLA